MFTSIANRFREVVSRRYRVRLDRGSARLTIDVDRAGRITQLDLVEAAVD